MLVIFANTIPWAIGATKGELGACSHVTHVALFTCDPPPLWGALDQLEKVTDRCALKALQSLLPTPTT